MKGNPLQRVRNWRRRAIPIFFHGDGVPVTGVGKSWGKSVDSYNWGSLLAQGSTADLVFLIWAIFQELQLRARTKKLFWKIMTWSFTALFDGKWPTRDHNNVLFPAGSVDGLRGGSPLVGTDQRNFPFCVIWQLKGDLDFDHKVY